MLRRPTFEPLFTTHPSEVGSTSPWTLLDAMMRGPLSRPICREATTCCGFLTAIQGASAWSSCLLSALAMRCAIAVHPIHAQNFTIWSHSTAQVPCSRLASTCSDVSFRTPCFEILVTFPSFPSLNRLFCARRINATRESLFQKLARRDNATSLFFFGKDLKRQSDPPVLSA